MEKWGNKGRRLQKPHCLTDLYYFWATRPSLVKKKSREAYRPPQDQYLLGIGIGTAPAAIGKTRRHNF